MSEEQESHTETVSDAAPAAAPEPGPPAAAPRAWGLPIFKLDVAWTRFETWLVVIVLAMEALSLSLWVALKCISMPADGDAKAGLMFRALFGAVVLGSIAYHGLRRQPDTVRHAAAITGAVVGLCLARAWGSFGVSYASNLLNWYQQASTLTLFGGLRGIGTRLTLLLALLGGSLATARGKHITVDLVQRFVTTARVPIVVAGWVSAAFICGVLAWGFFDHIAIENFGAQSNATASSKLAKVGHELDEGFFILRKQVSLDFLSTSHIVFRAEPFSEWLDGKAWSRWLDDSGLVERYGAAAVDALRIPADETRAPIVTIPGRGEPRGELISAANLMYPLGFLIIAVRFLVRSLLAVSGHVSVDPDDGGDFTTDDAELEGKA